MTITTTKTYDILGRTFETCELHDIATHGASCGVSGFIYSSELYEVFATYEDEIMEVLEEFNEQTGCFKTAEQWVVETINDEEWTLQQFKEQAIWMCLEIKAQEITYND